ncbi:hypothetical protein PH547_30300 [Rhizobium sp. CNPSo 3464]|uniref:hypothetical protein n=1 Tax=Rhizobium sp. CNPSo 3464 TaxID=3021406 RepID=UPI00254CE518|nr:hypothetical protein [Rhizobium sp. CNPSo 3464]MDK4743180.1 hypothetical protein [Rhizobium sp. CNPSo 3464]
MSQLIATVCTSHPRLATCVELQIERNAILRSGSRVVGPRAVTSSICILDGSELRIDTVTPQTIRNSDTNSGVIEVLGAGTLR